MVGPSAKRIAERNAQFDHVRAGFCQREHKFQGGVQRRIAGGDVRDNAQFAGFAQQRTGDNRVD